MRIGHAGRRAQEASLYALLLLLPFSKAAVELTFGGLLIGWILERLDPATRADTGWGSKSLRPLAIAVAVYLGVCAASVLVSDFPAKSLSGLIGKWAEYLLLFLMTADVARRPAVIKRAFPLLAWSSFGVAAYAMCQFVQIATRDPSRAYPDPYHPLWFYGRMLGPYENPIDLATYVMVVLFVLLGYAVTCRGAARWAVGALMVLLTACLAKTQAVGAWLGGYAGFAALGVASPSRWRFRWILLIALVFAGAALLHRQGRLGEIVALADVGVQDRWAMWQAAIGMIRDRPLLGHGVNTFMANYLAYWVGGERQPRYAHNCYLQVAAETGLLGLAAFVALLGLLFARLLRSLPAPDAVRRAWRGQAPARPALQAPILMLGLVGGLVAFAVQAAIDTNFYSLRQAALFWTLAGVAIGVQQHGPSS